MIFANVVPPVLVICNVPDPVEAPIIVPVTVIAAGVSAEATINVDPEFNVIPVVVRVFFIVTVLLAETVIGPTVVAPITPVNVLLLPVMLITPSFRAAAVIAFVIVDAVSGAKTIVAGAELLSKVIVPPLKFLLNVPVEFSVVLVSPPITLPAVLTVTASANIAAPDLVELPIVNVSAVTAPEKVIVEILASALLIT